MQKYDLQAKILMIVNLAGTAEFEYKMIKTFT